MYYLFVGSYLNSTDYSGDTVRITDFGTADGVNIVPTLTTMIGNI